MRAEEHERMFRVEDEHFWFVGTRVIITDVLKRALGEKLRGACVLDVGCGTGYTLSCLPEGVHGVGLDASALALTLGASRGTRARFARGDATKLPFKNDVFDAVLALDVVEHLDEEHVATREMLRVLKPGGVAIITVPAFAWLWSKHDEALEHRRRYTLSKIESLFEVAGFRVVQSSYYDTILLPIVAAVRLSERIFADAGAPRREVRELSPFVNKVLTHVLAFERHLLPRMKLPAGVSCLLVCEKPLSR